MRDSPPADGALAKPRDLPAVLAAAHVRARRERDARDLLQAHDAAPSRVAAATDAARGRAATSHLAQPPLTVPVFAYVL